MNIHEYQAKQLLESYKIPVAKGVMVESFEQALKEIKNLKGSKWVLKAQIHAGGRGKAGGVKLCSTQEQIKEFFDAVLDRPLITHQTGAKGQIVKKIYIEEASEIKKEFYLALVLNRKDSRISFIASCEGGMDIEEVASNTPEKITKVAVDLSNKVMPYHARLIAKTLDIEHLTSKLYEVLKNMLDLYLNSEASLIEINPFVLTNDDNLIALDAKMNFDDNALFRNPLIANLRDADQEDATEIEAAQHELNYIKLDGEIGCLVNGAGLAMATMDVIKTYKKEPANFLDVGGSADQERVAKAFEIILKDKSVKAILVNIFGGIMRCDIIANGIIAAAKQLSLKVPLIVRLEGTNKDLGKQLLNESGLNIISADNLDDAAKKAVNAIK